MNSIDALIVTLGWIFLLSNVTVGLLIAAYYIAEGIRRWGENSALFYDYLINKKKFKEWKAKK